MTEPNQLTEKEVADILTEHIQYPVAIADGGCFLAWEENLCRLFRNHNIDFDALEFLYKKPFDLSKYKTICFTSTFTYEEKVKKLFDFDKNNLKLVITDFYTYDTIQSLAEDLGIKIIAADLSFGFPIYERNIKVK